MDKVWQSRVRQGQFHHREACLSQGSGRQKGRCRRTPRESTPKLDYAQVVDDLCNDDDERCPPQTAITESTLRSDGRLQHLLVLRKGVRKQLLDVSSDERRQLYLLRKAEEKVHKLARKNRRLSMLHAKGEKRKTQRPGVGKSGLSSSWWALENADIEAALGHAHTSAQEGLSGSECQPSGSDADIDLASLLEQLIRACQPSLWDEAVQRAEISAKLNMRTRCLAGTDLPKELQVLARLLEETGGPFDSLRVKFLKTHGKALVDALHQCTEGLTLTPAPLAPEVQERFLTVAASGKGKHMRQISPGFHGTPATVHNAIFNSGLLIPGENNDLKVANGSAHGNGVYIAKLSNPWLSQSFAYGANKMLVCGVVDDAANLAQAQRLGSFLMSKESSNVRHVGDAMVVFESARVAPLFVVEWLNACRRPSMTPPTTKKQARQTQPKWNHRWRNRGVRCARRR